MKHFTLIATLLLFLPISGLYAQESKVVRDFRLRTIVEVEKELLDVLEVFGSTAIEFQENTSTIGKYYGEIGFAYKPWKFISSSLDYRRTKSRSYFKDNFKRTNRVGLHLEGKYKLDRFKFYLRLRYQTIDDDFVFYESEEPNKNLIRGRLKIKYNLTKTKLTPFVSSELYLLANENYAPVKYKLTAGAKYEIKNIGELATYYRLEKEIDSLLPYTFNTLGISIKFIL